MKFWLGYLESKWACVGSWAKALGIVQQDQSMRMANLSKEGELSKMRIFRGKEGERADHAWGSIGGH